MLSGEPEEWLLEPSPEKDLLLGEPLAVTAAVELLFLLPRLRPSCRPRPCDDDTCAGGWECCVPGDWWWWWWWWLLW